MQLAVELNRVSYAYRPGQPVLRDVTLQVPAGEFVAIAGPNGGGKTTLLRLIVGLLRPQQGSVRVFAEGVEDVSRRSLIGYLAQRAQLGIDAPASVREVVAAGCVSRERLIGPLRSSDRARAEKAIERVGLARQAQAPLSTLSGGQQQRAFIAKALAGAPRLLVLDEPTAGVDADAQEALAELLAELQRDLQVTILYVSHEFGAVEHVAQRLLLIRGAVAFDGKPETFPSAGTTPRTSMLSHEFMRLAFASGAVIGVLAPAVGFFLVQRRMSLIGDGIGHVAFAGVAAGYLIGISPVATALVASVAGAIAVEWLRANRRTAGDQALALLFYTGIALGVVLISAAGALNANLFAFLFGSILTVTRGDLLLVAGLGIAGLALIALLYRALVAARSTKKPPESPGSRSDS